MRNKRNLFVAAMAKRLEPSDSRKLDVWWGKRWQKIKALLWLPCLNVLLGYDVEYYLPCFVLLKFYYISLVMVSLPLFVCLCVCCICNDRITCVLYRSRWYCICFWHGVEWWEAGDELRILYSFIKLFFHIGSRRCKYLYLCSLFEIF